jgi:choline dehydrogenase-like flavoprotein
VAAGQSTAVQNTSLALDALARNICNTWDEAVGGGDRGFDVVIVGSGAYGAYLAAKLFRLSDSLRVLVLEAGPFLVSEHVQNLGDVGLNVAGAIDPASDPGVPRELVWGLPWRGNTPFPGLAYCCGGKSLYWGGWCPRLTEVDLAEWPAEAADYLRQHYLEVESEIGVVPGTDFISGDLLQALTDKLTVIAPAVPDLDQGITGGPIQPAPIAVQGASPVSGLFSFDKYSSLPLLTEAIRDDIRQASGNDRDRRLFLVPRAHVLNLQVAEGRAQAVEVDVGGTRTSLPIGPGAKVVLAASTIESTRLALLSLADPNIGGNLMAHVRSDFSVRIHRSALAPVPGHVQTAALLVRGRATNGCRFHLQLTAATSRAGSDALLYQMIPDLDLLGQQLANDDPDWIALTVRGIGQMTGERAGATLAGSASWINLSPFESDEFGRPRAYVNLVASERDIATWTAMDQAALGLLRQLAGTAQNIQYRYDGGWQDEPFPLDRPYPPWHWGLGTTYHEAGTLWMGADAASSVTDPTGRFHRASNLYSADQAAFPTVGSVNPVLTGLTLAHRLADTLVANA